MRKQSGLSILELMMTVAIVSILLTVVAPNVQDLLIRNRIIAEVNQLSSVIQFARHTAIDEQATTVVCATNNFTDCSGDWTLPKMVFVDEDNNGTRTVDEEILAGTELSSASHVVTGPANGFRFLGNGSVAAMGTLLICHQNGDAQYARALVVSLQGRVRLSRDGNGDGIHENNAGAALVC